MRNTRLIEIKEGVFLTQPQQSFSIHLVVNTEENLIYCEPLWGERPKDISSMVKQLMKYEMIQKSVSDSNNIDVNVVVWEIGDDSNELYLETYHQNLTQEEWSMCEHDRIMLYRDFLNEVEYVN